MQVQYFLLFLEGIITFISPCLLPMIPIYISYFAGGKEKSSARTFFNAVAFVLGFTAVFVAMGALGGAVGGFFIKCRTAINIVTGLIVIIMGLGFMGAFEMKIFRGVNISANNDNMGFFSALLFGMIFSIGWTPCVGTMLTSALAIASREGSALSGALMLLVYSLGLGVPFIISAVLVDKLKSTFDFIKRNYKVINIISGAILIAVGLLMATGLLDYALGFLTIGVQ